MEANIAHEHMKINDRYPVARYPSEHLKCCPGPISSWTPQSARHHDTATIHVRFVRVCPQASSHVFSLIITTQGEGEWCMILHIT